VNTHCTLRKVFAFSDVTWRSPRGYRTAFAMEIFEAFFGRATLYHLYRFYCFVSTNPAQASWGGVYGIKPRRIVARFKRALVRSLLARIRNLQLRITRTHSVRF
jgi:hypothetical protein